MFYFHFVNSQMPHLLNFDIHKHIKIIFVTFAVCISVKKKKKFPKLSRMITALIAFYAWTCTLRALIVQSFIMCTAHPLPRCKRPIKGGSAGTLPLAKQQGEHNKGVSWLREEDHRCLLKQQKPESQATVSTSTISVRFAALFASNTKQNSWTENTDKTQSNLKCQHLKYRYLLLRGFQWLT